MLPEIQRGELTSLIQKREDSEDFAALEKQEKKKFAIRLKALYEEAGTILDVSPLVPIMGDIRYPHAHHLTRPVSFANGGGYIDVRMRELVQPSEATPAESRYGISIELDDATSPIENNVLFQIFPHIITTGEPDGNSITPEERNVSELEIVEALVEQIKLKLSYCP